MPTAQLTHPATQGAVDHILGEVHHGQEWRANVGPKDRATQSNRLEALWLGRLKEYAASTLVRSEAADVSVRLRHSQRDHHSRREGSRPDSDHWSIVVSSPVGFHLVTDDEPIPTFTRAGLWDY